MGLFGFSRKQKDIKFFISEQDRIWVEDNFKWILESFGYPLQNLEPILFSKDFFPETFKAEKIEINNLIEDLSGLLVLDSKKISFETEEDFRDIEGLPFKTEGSNFEIVTEIANNKYKIVIAKSLLKNSKRLLYKLICEFIEIKLKESKLNFDTGYDTDLFILIAGIYFGFGVIFSQNQIDNGSFDEGMYVTKWNFVSAMPNETMVYALAIYSKLTDNDKPNWLEKMPNELRVFFPKALEHFNSFSNDLFSESELEILSLFNNAEIEYKNKNFAAGILSLEKIMFLTKDEMVKAQVYNDIGYNQIRMNDLENSVPNFYQALKIDSNYGFALDNLAYVNIISGQLEIGKEYIEKAIKTENSDNAYSNRNFALYYFAKGEMLEAEKYFHKALDSSTNSVDFLEFHYAEFLFAQNKFDEGQIYLKKAKEKGEYKKHNS